MDEAMSRGVAHTRASREVPFVAPAAEWFGWVDGGNSPDVFGSYLDDTATEQEVILAQQEQQALEEDTSAQVTAAQDFTTLVAAEIVNSADAAIEAAARLGSHRVISLLGWIYAGSDCPDLKDNRGRSR
jgi:hypothetical protein